MILLNRVILESNSVVSAIGVTSSGSTLPGRKPGILPLRFVVALIESRRNRTRLVTNSIAAPSKVQLAPAISRSQTPDHSTKRHHPPARS